MSTASQSLLRAVSFDTHDHLAKLTQKANALAQANTAAATALFTALDDAARSTVEAVAAHHEKRVREVWAAYLRDQPPLPGDETIFAAGAALTRETFAALLRARSLHFVETAKAETLESVFRAIEARCPTRVFLSEEAAAIANGALAAAEARNAELRTQTARAKAEAIEALAQGRARHEKLRAVHLDANDSEFRLRLAGDPALRAQTLAEALPRLRQKKRRLEEQFQHLQGKAGSDELRLAHEVMLLEKELSLLNSSQT